MAPFEVMDVVRAARERDESRRPGDPTTCHLEVGQPGHATPAAVRDAARAALDGPLPYTEGLGTPELRARIARFYDERYGVEVDPGRIAVTGGASAGCVLAFLAAFDIGGRVALGEPGYPCYANILDALGIEAVGLPIGADTKYQLTAGALDRAGPLDGVVVASPSNPTGAVMGTEELQGLAGWCRAHDALLLVDEIYHGITDRPVPTAAALDHTVVIQSFSKYFCMTGWRLGWLVVPPELVRPVERLAQNFYLCPPTLSQVAALAAFDATAELDAHAEGYRRNRRVLLAALERAGVDDIAPAEGAFYVWADLGAWGRSGELCGQWLDEIGVACTPGTDFDPRRGEDFVRFSVAGPADEVAEASRRLEAWLVGHRAPHSSTRPAGGSPP